MCSGNTEVGDTLNIQDELYYLADEWGQRLINKQITKRTFGGKKYRIILF